VLPFVLPAVLSDELLLAAFDEDRSINWMMRKLESLILGRTTDWRNCAHASYCRIATGIQACDVTWSVDRRYGVMVAKRSTEYSMTILRTRARAGMAGRLTAKEHFGTL